MNRVFSAHKICQSPNPPLGDWQIVFWLKKLCLAIALILLSAPAFAAYEVKQTKSAWYLQDNSLPIISIKIAFEDAGYAYDSKSGLAYFVSGMLNEGAGIYDSETFQRLLDENAIGFSASVDNDDFYIEVKTLSQNLELALDMLNAAITKPHFAAKETEIVRTQIQTILAKKKESPGDLAGELMMKTIFKNHPYAKTEEGDVESIALITSEDMQQFVQNNFRLDNIKIAIVGDVDETKVEKITSKIKKGLSKAEFKNHPIPEFTNYPSGYDSKTQIQNPQSVIMFAMPGVKREDPNFYAAYILNHIIGGSGFQARLYKEIREKRGLSYYTGTSLVPYDHAELIVGTLATTAKQAKESKEVVREIFRDISENGVTADELADAKSYITGSFPLNLDKNSKIADYILMMQLNNLGADYLKNRNALMDAVTLEQINKVAKALVSPEKLGFVTVGK